jgi:hypothetical protein
MISCLVLGVFLVGPSHWFTSFLLTLLGPSYNITLVFSLLVLDHLEKEMIKIFKEAVATFRKSVMLFCIGKESCILLRQDSKYWVGVWSGRKSSAKALLTIMCRSTEIPN